MSKRFISIAMVLIVSIGLVFAGGEKEGVAKEAKPVVVQLGYENNPGEPIDLAAKEWQRIIAEKSNGTMKLELFPSSQLGSKMDLVDQMLAGSSVCTLADGAFYAERGVPDFGIVFGPYLFTSWDDCWRLIESDWYNEQSEKLAKNGLRLISSNWIYGDRHTLTKKPVHTPSDLKGMKIRVANSMVFIKGFEVLGATPTPLALGEVYTALQQGVVDGLENPLTTLDGGKFQEVAKYLILDGHVKNFTTFIVGETFFKSLTAEQQKILIDSANEAGLYNNSIQVELEQQAMKNLVAGGVTVYTPSEAELKQFQDAAKAFYTDPQVTAKWTPGLYDTVMKAMGK
jgi:tripartite ATP-independent transporter DctP family solute receptor